VAPWQGGEVVEGGSGRSGGGRSGDGFVRCDDGHVRWGRFGAAGVVFVVDGDTGPEVLLQLRSAFAHEGGTWSCPGGAIDEGESALEAALREAAEEVGAPPDPWHLVGEHVFAPAGDWRYTTAVVAVPHRFGTSRNFETDEVHWFAPAAVEGLGLHPGFAAAWPHLRAIVEAAEAGGRARDR
jgi:8-oxo-dGTP pyrophosphatase MutT (NUDIX family)